jgi:DNA polymerase V
MSFPETQRPLFALIDCNNFYVACERVFNPKLLNRPVVVLSNNDGCVIARSKEAKTLGIKMGTPTFKLMDEFKAKGVITCSSNYALYGDMSRRVMETIRHFSPEVQVYSIDEAFALINGNNAHSVAKEMKSTLLKWTGIPVSIGISQTKTLAKIANHCSKKEGANKGIYNLSTSAEQENVLRSFSVKDIWGIGCQMSAFLIKNNIFSAWDLKNADDTWVKHHLTIVGLRVVWELRGISCLNLEEVRAPKKTVMSSRSFSRSVTTKEELEEAVSTYTARAALKIRQQNSLASYVEVFVKTNRFQKDYYWKTCQILLPEPTAYTPLLVHFAKQALNSIFLEGLLYKKAGALLGGLVPKESYQQNLFDNQKDNICKQNKLMTLMDDLNAKLGKKTLRFASEGIKQNWQMQRNQLSSRFTTRWSELLVIKNSL